MCILLLSVVLSANAFSHPIDMDAIAHIESSGNPGALGQNGEIGLYQISPVALLHFRQATGYVGGDLLDPEFNFIVANWYMNWLYDRTWTVKDTLIAWNWGIGNWRQWKVENNKVFPDEHGILTLYRYYALPQITMDYLKKYEQITGEKL